MKLFSTLFFAFLIFTVKAQTSLKFSVYFDVNQSKIKTKDYLVLDSVVQILKIKTNIKRIQINGYADTTGGAEANLELSNNRTDTVAGYILSKNLLMYKNRVATASLGEKVTGKETDLEQMRRVDIVILMARADRDTIIRTGCISAMIPANTFEGFNNDELIFKLEYLSNAADIKKYNMAFKDVDGNPLLSNGVVKVTAMYKNKPVKAIKSITINIPKINNETGYFAYQGIEDKAKNLTWKLTDERVINIGYKKATNGDDCDLQSFNIKDVNRFYNSAKVRPACYCAADAFGGLQTPNKSEPMAKFGQAGTIVLVNESSFKKVAADKAYVQVVDELTKDDYLNFCNSFLYPGISDIPMIPKFEREVVDFLDLNVSQKNDSADIIMSKKDMVLVMVPKSKLPAHAGKRYALLPADTKKDNFFNWTKKIVFADSCRGLANCDYVIFEVPFTGFYTILELTPVAGKGKGSASAGNDNAGEDGENDKALKGKNIKIKIKKFNGVNVIYGLKDDNTTTSAKFLKNKGKNSFVESNISKKEKKNYKAHVFLAYVIKDGKRYAWIGKGSELKTGFLSGNWKTPKLVYVPDEEWESFCRKACE
ncbi:MAG: OmpA family protein [bacterium]|nr:OmpA family protein [bacterium]